MQFFINSTRDGNRTRQSDQIVRLAQQNDSFGQATVFDHFHYPSTSNARGVRPNDRSKKTFFSAGRTKFVRLPSLNVMTGCISQIIYIQIGRRSINYSEFTVTDIQTAT